MIPRMLWMLPKKLTDQYMKQIDDILAKKEKEVMSI